MDDLTPRDPDCPVCRAAPAMSVAFDIPLRDECTHRMPAGVPRIPVCKVRDFVPVTFGPPDVLATEET